MRAVLLIMLLLIPCVLANALITVDLLRPIDPEARYGDAAREFEAAKRLVQSDLRRALENASEENVRRLELSVEILGDIGGYTAPGVQKLESRSLGIYRDVLALIADMRAAAEVEPAATTERSGPGTEFAVVEPVAQPVIVVEESVSIDAPARKGWLHWNLWSWFIRA